jgi:hypothetical protein
MLVAIRLNRAAHVIHDREHDAVRVAHAVRIVRFSDLVALDARC